MGIHFKNNYLSFNYNINKIFMGPTISTETISDETICNEIIIKREDLVDQYAGWTISKTNTFLKQNLGKTIKIIDKLNLSNNIYDIEAMNEIRIFLSKHPDQIIYHINNKIKGYNIDWNNSLNDAFDIKIVTRSDFIGKYVGWTKIKTNTLLNDNIGGTLLITGKFLINKHDGYGIEAMNEIKDFLDQHHNEIIIKVNGIKIESSIIQKEDPNIIKVRRHNLISNYVSHSYDKTTNFLLDNLGKTIIIIDDLVTNNYDSYGKEIEKSINDFLIQHPGKIHIKYYNRPNSCM